MRGHFNASLAVQSGDDPYDAQSAPAKSTGGVSLGPAAAASSAVALAAALEGPRILHCDLCQANFRGEALLRQHLEGPAHRKAEARAEALRLRNERLGHNRGAAEAAVAAAAWANGAGAAGDPATSPMPQAGGPAAQGAAPAAASWRPPPAAQHAGRDGERHRGGEGNGRGGSGRGGRGGRSSALAAEREAAAAAGAAPRAAQVSHGELVARARRSGEPLSLGGWVPPIIPEAQAPAERPERPASGADSDGGSGSEDSGAPGDQPKFESFF
ncbi:hypothetical protein WJX81_008172 [Elliptochloris bilobata]|uniref:C2H2-type domain-containing protein n=1 Tax=Elliptochloris bilobata TaxID=381761 RepID=A0AAW1RR89_9CHLO